MTSSEETTRVTIFTSSYRIEGAIALLPGSRLTDYVRSSAAFIAVIDAVVHDRVGTRLFAASFLDLAREHIEIILPTAFVQG